MILDSVNVDIILLNFLEEFRQKKEDRSKNFNANEILHNFKFYILVKVIL